MFPDHQSKQRHTEQKTTLLSILPDKDTNSSILLYSKKLYEKGIIESPCTNDPEI